MVHVTAAQARENFSDLCNRVMYKGERIVIVRGKKETPVAAFVPVHTLQTLERLEKMLDEDRALYALNEEAEGKKPLTLEELKARLGI